jgi:hypothetical protein
MRPPSLSPNQILEPHLPEDSSIKLIGLGGVGSIVARYLAMFLASLNRNVRLVLIDGDSFEPSNATRMFFTNFGNKALVTREGLLPQFVNSSLALIAIEEYVTAKNVARLIHEGDTVILTVDNHATRKLVSDFCAQELREVCLISGGNDGVGPDGSGRVLRGTFGNVQAYVRRAGADLTPSLTQYHPEIRKPVDHAPSDKSCTELVTSVPQLLFTNLTVASAILNTYWLHVCGALHYAELSFDIAEGLMRPSLPACWSAELHSA